MNAWGVSDAMLKRLLDAVRTTQGSLMWHCAFYQNDYTPVPTSETGSFVWANYPGYVTQDFPFSDFPPASVTTNVAMLTLSHALTFTASSTGSFSQTVYGYAVFDSSWNYMWAERFATPYTVGPSAVVTLTPRYKSTVCAPGTTRRRRSRAVRV